MKMKAAMFFGSGDVRLQEMDVPEVGPGEILVKIGTALTCGSDFKAYRQGHPVLLGDTLPAPFGHELAGEIVEVGRGVTHLKKGMRVVAANSAPCDRCHFCKRGKTNLCENLDLLNGAYAEYIRIPSQIVKHNTYEIPAHMSYKEAAITEPFSCAVHAFHRLNPSKDDTVVILGCGIMGLFFSAVAKHHGISVIAVGRNKDKLDRARKIGVDQVLDVSNVENPTEYIQRHTPDGMGADFVIEAVGKPEAWEQAFNLAKKGGTVCLFGGCKKGSTFSLDTHRVHYQEVSVMGIFHHTPEYFAKALDYLSLGLLDIDMFVTSEVRLDRIPEYFDTAANASPFKAAVIP